MPPSPCGRFRRALRLIGWNLLLAVGGVALAAIAGEAYFRLTVPFMNSFKPRVSIPNVGYLRPPNTEIRHTNRLDFWNVSRTNSLGFLDREPPNPERAAASCHVSIIGDSFVEAREVPIDDKLQVRLEELAANRLPHLDITTSAFGISNTGQVQQLPFYDEYARRLRPKLLVLVFVHNDFSDNAPLLRKVQLEARGWNHRLEPTVGRRPDGELELAWSLPQDPLPSISPTPAPNLASWAVRAARKTVNRSWFGLWLCGRKGCFPPDRDRRRTAMIELTEVRRTFARNELHPLFEDGLQYTRFALDQFKQRADRDRAKLVILASHTLKINDPIFFKLMSKMAATLGIPVIDQSDYILRQGATLSDTQWPHDRHWNPAGHQWAAEALLEYIEEHPTICDRPTGPGARLEPTP